MERIRALLRFLYGETTATALIPRLNALLDRYSSLLPAPVQPVQNRLSHRDAFLITYADQVLENGVPPLESLSGFCKVFVQGIITTIHLLPFYPSSSDDGFSVTDYREVDPSLGSWMDVKRIRDSFFLMFDAVINHASSQSDWFRRFLAGDPAYRDFFIAVEGDAGLSRVVRPRTHPVLSTFRSDAGEKRIWTTFSQDQVDLNFRNPEVLLNILDLLLFYVSRGADLLRLDAIAYLWKESGTSCIHLPQTHAIIQLIRAFLDLAAPHVRMITETNVSHEENISYFGDGRNESHMVYNFALPPLVLHTLSTGNSRHITRWAASLQLSSDGVTFLNFLASHDGIGINPARGILSEMEIEALARHCKQNGGLVSYKRNPDGAEVPYELNINYLDALSESSMRDPLQLGIQRFVAAHFIMLSLMGVPAFYFHSLFGSRGWLEGPLQTGRARSINREKLERTRLDAELNDPGSLRSRVFRKLRGLLETRAQHPAFDPFGKMEVLDLGEAFFAVLRTNAHANERILCIQNVTDRPQGVILPSGEFTDLSTPGAPVLSEHMSLEPYQGVWLN